MSHFCRRLAILAILVAAPVAGEAATYRVAPTFVGALDFDFQPIPGYDVYSRQPAILQFDFLIYTGDFAADQYGFANGVFTISTRGLSNTTLPGWYPSPIPNVDSNGAAPGGRVPLLSDNADLAAQDLKDILIGVATPLTTNPAVDPRFRFGQGTAPYFNAGSVFFDYQGGLFVVWSGFTQASAIYRDGAGNRYIGLVDPLATRSVALRANMLPEPATAAFVVMAILGAAVRRH
jgi:hypothetical protein